MDVMNVTFPVATYETWIPLLGLHLWLSDMYLQACRGCAIPHSKAFDSFGSSNFAKPGGTHSDLWSVRGSFARTPYEKRALAIGRYLPSDCPGDKS